tara:strand:+ start:15723 stop:16055 length:333 start_codon:yes stop_codon:yes gene_type:complete
VVEPTVIADAALAGDELHASASSFPAAATTTTPASTARAMARLIVPDLPLPKLIDATVGHPFRVLCFITQSIPFNTLLLVPEPEQPNILTACSVAFLATPQRVPPTVPAQ